MFNVVIYCILDNKTKMLKVDVTRTLHSHTHCERFSIGTLLQKKDTCTPIVISEAVSYRGRSLCTVYIY